MRKKYIDNMRWITVVLVVIYHVIYMFNGVGVLGGAGALSKTQYRICFYTRVLSVIYAVAVCRIGDVRSVLS